MTGTKIEINEFLGCRRVALVGASRQEKDFSAMLLRELRKRGYDMVPVNPLAESVQGLRSYARVPEIMPAVEAALLLTPAPATEQVVRDCVAAGVRRVWIFGAGHGSAANESAVRLCRENGIKAIEGHCPLMFLPQAGFIHWAHGAILKIGGKYPRATA